eukprot:10441853-Alexandrium_andersonii.AAC.1
MESAKRCARGLERRRAAASRACGVSKKRSEAPVSSAGTREATRRNRPAMRQQPVSYTHLRAHETSAHL